MSHLEGAGPGSLFQRFQPPSVLLYHLNQRILHLILTVATVGGGHKFRIKKCAIQIDLITTIGLLQARLSISKSHTTMLAGLHFFTRFAFKLSVCFWTFCVILRLRDILRPSVVRNLQAGHSWILDTNLSENSVTRNWNRGGGRASPVVLP